MRTSSNGNKSNGIPTRAEVLCEHHGVDLALVGAAGAAHRRCFRGLAVDTRGQSPLC